MAALATSKRWYSSFPKQSRDRVRLYPFRAASTDTMLVDVLPAHFCNRICESAMKSGANPLPGTSKIHRPGSVDCCKALTVRASSYLNRVLAMVLSLFSLFFFLVSSLRSSTCFYRSPPSFVCFRRSIFYLYLFFSAVCVWNLTAATTRQNTWYTGVPSICDHPEDGKGARHSLISPRLATLYLTTSGRSFSR